jgi:hypothetical protein
LIVVDIEVRPKIPYDDDDDDDDDGGGGGRQGGQLYGMRTAH